MTTLSYQDFLQAACSTLLDPHIAEKRNAVLVVNFERMSDLDGVLGYTAVDEIVLRASKRLGGMLSSKDLLGLTDRHQICCLLVDLLTDSHVMLAAHKILRMLSPPFMSNGRNIILMPRVGVAMSGLNNCDELGRLMSNASSALRQARLEQESIRLYVEEEEDLLLSGIDLWSELGQAIESNTLYLGYQPQINVASGKIESTEALLRWRHPKHGLIRPDKLVQVAEGTELMSKLTLWVFHTALRECAEYRKAGLDAGVSINFSADDLREPELIELVMQGLDIWTVPAEKVLIELTETAVMGDHPGSLKTLCELKNIGFKLAMDDFGTGYSSMARLLELPLDEVKIDMMFVKNMTTQHTHERIVDSMIGLGHRLNLRVVAEGVEDLATYKSLRELGCDTIQGHFIGQAMPSAELIEKFLNQPPNFP